MAGAISAFRVTRNLDACTAPCYTLPQQQQAYHAQAGHGGETAGVAIARAGDRASPLRSWLTAAGPQRHAVVRGPFGWLPAW